MASTTGIKTGERRTATILFADLKGFTSLSERMDPEEMDSLMGAVFGAFEGIIRDRGGTVEKYIGDALVAVFGVPEVHEDDPRRAVESALAFLDRKESLAAELSLGDEDLRFRIGVHEGLVATGTRGEFEVVTGHAMAVAQRLQGAAEPDGVLVSDPVKERCERDFEFQGPMDVSAKGKTEAIAAWLVLGPAAGNARDKGPFVGRKDILDELLRSYIKDDATTLAGRFLVGEAGIGKSRLVSALAERARGFPDFASPVLAVRAQKYRHARYSVPTDILLSWLGLEAGAGEDVIGTALAAMPGVDPAHAGRVAALFGTRESARPETDAVLSLFNVFQALLERYARAIYPVLLFIDDAQSMDRESREFFQYLFRNARVKPFAVMAGRDHPQSLRDAFPELKPLKLAPLPPADSRALALAWWPECPDALLERILSQSMGNPLFIREYTLFARKHRDLSSLPGTIQNMFMTSLERYEPALRDFLRVMSAFIVHFTEEEAARVFAAAGGDPATVPRAIRRFLKDGLLARDGGHYAFALDVLKKALYAGLLNHNKRIIHGAIADIMAERERPNRLRHIHHLMRAERWAEAADVMRRDPARNYRFEYLEYLDPLYKRLSRIAADEAIQLLLIKSALYFNSGKIDEAEQELKRVMRVAVEQRNDNCMGFAYHMICAYNNMSYAFQKAQFTGQKALYYYRRVGMSARSVQNVVRTIAFAEIQRNNFEEARALVDQTESLPGRDELEYAGSRAEFRLFSGDYRGALAALQSITSPTSAEDYGAVTRFFGMDLKLKILWQLCDFRALGPAARELLEAGSLSEPAMAQAHAMAAASAAVLGDPAAAREGFLRAEFFTEQARNDFDRIDALRTLALCLLVAGQDARAETFARDGLVLGLRHSCYYPAFTLAMILVVTAHRRGDLAEARFFLKEASWFFSTGLLLPYKDVIFYYYYMGRLSDGPAAAKNAELARSLLADEKARIGDPALVENLLRLRGMAEVEGAPAGAGGTDR